MTVLTIRAHRRFGVCRPVRLRREGEGAGASALAGLLVEVSLEGCRVSNLRRAEFAQGDAVTVEIAGGEVIQARVRWCHDGIAGLQLVKPLHNAELADLIALCRSEPAPAKARRA